MLLHIGKVATCYEQAWYNTTFAWFVPPKLEAFQLLDVGDYSA